MRALILSAITIASASLIASVSTAVAQGDADPIAVVTKAGVTVEVDTEAWRGEPRRFDKVLPVLVRITNDGDVPLRVRHSDFALVTETGERVPATRWTTYGASSRSSCRRRTWCRAPCPRRSWSRGTG